MTFEKTGIEIKHTHPQCVARTRAAHFVIPTTVFFFMSNPRCSARLRRRGSSRNPQGAPTRIEQFGATGDRPVVSDYDGDGKADVGIIRAAATGAEWWINRSTAGILALQFGDNADKAVQGDYTGDGKADVAIWRPSTGEWLIVRSEDFSFFGFPFGTAGDVVGPGDYDGDGRFDATVFRPSSTTWFIGRTTQIVQFGATEDRPIWNAFVP